jgi:catechol 2,3-dioxygenase-like lactoylglutathione lyase family enzyme
MRSRLPSLAVRTSESGFHSMLDHVFPPVDDMDRSTAFYTATLAPLGITHSHDYDGRNGPPGHPDLRGFGANGRVFFWLRKGIAGGQAVHVGFVASGSAAVDAAYAANVFDPDGYNLEFVYKSWQHGN